MHTLIARGSRLLAAGLIAAATLAACSSTTSSPLMSGGVSAKFRDGTANVKLTGGYDLSYVARFLTGATASGGTAMSIQYGNVQTGALTYQGPATVGSYPTTRTATAITTLGLTAVLPSGPKPSDSFSSVNGECTVTITKSDATGGQATFTCTGLKNQDGSVTVDATGSWDWLAAPS